MVRKFRKVAKDEKTAVPKKYLSGAKNKAKRASEIKRTARAYKRCEFIDLEAVQKSRTENNGRKKTRKKTTKRKR